MISMVLVEEGPLCARSSGWPNIGSVGWETLNLFPNSMLGGVTYIR